MIVVVNKYLLAKGFRGISLWPFIVLKHTSLKKDKIFLNHERIHLRQQLELLIIPFYIWYITEFVIKFFIYKSASSAYRNISFEREAYKQEKNFEYLNKRPFWAFLGYY